MKQLKHFVKNYDFEGDKNQVWGEYRGYQFVIGRYENNNNIITIFTALTFEDSTGEESLSPLLETMLSKKEIQEYESDRGSLTIKRIKHFGRISIKELESLLDNLVNEFEKIKAKPACFNCKIEGKQKFALYSNIATTLCSSCYSSISNDINEIAVTHATTQNNYVSGTIGAILGALLGSVLWVVIGLLGYIASLAGFAITIASVKGYLLFKGKITRVSVWIIGLSSFAALILAQFVTLDIIFYRELKSAGFDISVLDALHVMFELPFISSELTMEFIKDTVLGLVFASLGAYGTFKNLLEEATSPAGSLEWL